MDLGVQVFRLSEESLRRTLRMQLRGGAILLGIVLFIGVGAAVEQAADVRVAIVLIGVILVLSMLGVLRERTRAEKRHRAYGWAIGPDVLRHVSSEAPPVEMARTEIVRIQESPSGLLLEAVRPRRAVFVPAGVERYALARELLTSWRAPEPLIRRGPTRAIALGGMAMGLLAWFGGRYLESSVAAAACTLVYALIAGWFSWVVFREQLIPPKTRALFVILAAGGLLVLVWRLLLPALGGGP